jgi:hypothetical protein
MSGGGTWQPIETAPRDGSIVWVANPHSICVAYFAGKEERCWRNWYRGNRYENVHISTDAYLPEPVWFDPTHWQPTPKPPESA